MRPDGTDLRARALALHQEGQAAAALALYRQLLESDGGDWTLLRLAGIAAAQCGDGASAVAALRRATELAPREAVAHHDLAVCLVSLGRKDEALAHLGQACALAPAWLEAQRQRIALLRERQGAAAALAALIALPADAKASPAVLAALRHEQGMACAQLGRHVDAVSALRQALALVPGDATMHLQLALSLQHLGESESALASFNRALQLRPDDALSLRSRAAALGALHRHEEALRDLRQAMAIEPQAPLLRGHCLHAAMQLADWSGWDAERMALRQALEAGEAAAPPFAVLALFDDPALQRQAATNYVRMRLPPAAAPLAPYRRGERIRLAYVSADFHDHATAQLMAGLFEHHDRQRFELVAVSLGPDAPGDAYRTRLQRRFDQFLELRQLDDAAIAAQLRALQIDIAIDLTGYTREARPGVFAARAAPLQLAYLGFPATMGAPFIDYAIVDPVIVPAGQDVHFAETLLRLPGCYQVNDDRRPRPGPTPPREALGLPAQALVLASFNAIYKLNPPQFALWMRLLRQVPDAVLWLLEGPPEAQRRLRDQARLQGVEPARVIFAPRLPTAEHLARHGAADLFLDTLPCNAHTTAADALWCGLPLLTQPGHSLAARVAASLLKAQGLDELVCNDEAQLEALVLALAQDRPRLQAIRERMLTLRDTGPLFDTARFTRHFERALQQVYERQQAGLAPTSMSLDDAG